MRGGAAVRRTARFFEQTIEATNRVYAAQKRAVINKIATPTQSVKGRMTFTAQSTVDYVGVMAKGRFVAFDAKTTHGDTFPMAHIRPHQVDYLRAVRDMGGAAFFLVWMVEHSRVWIVPVTEDFLETHWRPARRPSMTLADFDRFGIEVPDWSGTYPQCDYLTAAKTWNGGGKIVDPRPADLSHVV